MKFDARAGRSLERGYRTPEIAHQRLRTLAALAPGNGEHVLDVGCGPGFLVAEMAMQVGPEGRVVGLDNSPDMLELANARCREFPQVTLTDGIIQDIAEADGAFDAAACTQLLLFIEDVPQALGELHRVLKPGGRVAVLETDWRGVVLASDDLLLTRELFDYWDGRAKNPNLPTRLMPMLAAAGFTAPKVEAVPIVNTSFTKDNFSNGFIRGLARKATEDGAIDEATAKDWVAEMRRRDADGGYFFCVNRFLFSAVKV